MSGQREYTEQRLLTLTEDLKLVKTVNNFLPLMPSPILQQLFKQTASNKITSINVERLLEIVESFLDDMSARMMKQDLYVPYVASINIWNNLIFGNLPKSEKLINHGYHVLQRLQSNQIRLEDLSFKFQ